MKSCVEEVFVTEGVPNYTFIAPPNFNDILLDIRKPLKPLIIEGQSGTGKTTCVKKAIERLGQAGIKYLTARDDTHVSQIEKLVATPFAGTFVIDDFHRLAEGIQAELANLAKHAAEQDATDSGLPKLVLIGINQIGSDLIQLVPDIAKRVGIHRIEPGSRDDITKLVTIGCSKLNVDIAEKDIVFAECRGDYWLAQQLCQQICLANNVMETAEVKIGLTVDITSLRDKVVARLKAAYYPSIKEFCRGQRFRPSNDPYYKLLRVISQQESSIVDLNELANAATEFRGSINNIKERRLTLLLQSKPSCSKQFYYNQETKNFAIEDPALFYFIKHLNWDQLRTDCGFRDNTKDYEWDIAISFAGENRDIARWIAENFEVLDVRVFFDEHYEVNMLGRALSDVFENVFKNDSRLVICLLDENYRKKIWPTFERQCFAHRVGEGEVIPVFLDQTLFVEISNDIFGIKFHEQKMQENWKELAIDQIVLKIGQHLEAIH
jgi:hypothetical protein